MLGFVLFCSGLRSDGVLEYSVFSVELNWGVRKRGVGLVGRWTKEDTEKR